MKNNVVLLGYMGCGKSTVGKVLAEKNALNFIDLDDYIEDKEQQTVAEIFSKKGEIYFRKLETEYLQTLLNNQTNMVLSLGGGTPCFGSNVELINKAKNVYSIYLQTSVKELSNRLYDQRGKRPLIAHANSQEELSEFIAKHLFERSAYYNKAKHIVKTDGKNVNDLVDEISNEIM